MIKRDKIIVFRRNIYVETYGCSLNRADSNTMMYLANSRGHNITTHISDSEVIILNTCTVRRDTDEKILDRIAKLKQRFKKNKIVVAGCLVSAQPYVIAKILDGTTYSLLSTHMVSRIIEALRKDIRKIEFNKNKTFHTHKNVVAIIPIADGCTGTCSFCITRIARPFLNSYPIEYIVKSARRVIKYGAREIQLTSQDLGAYGLDRYGRHMLPELVNSILEIPGDYMIRLGMMNPEHLLEIVDDVINVLKDPHVYKFLHIPLQSGSNNLLRIMNRRYTVEDYIYLIRYVRKKIEDIMIATDIIIGHPGESDNDFQETINVLKELEIERVHIAQYTPRPRTLAYALPQVKPHIRKHRLRKILKVIEEIGLKAHRKYVGKRIKVLTTEIGTNRTIVARTQSYYPVIIEKTGVQLGKWIYTDIHDATYYDLRGTIVSEQQYE